MVKFGSSAASVAVISAIVFLTGYHFGGKYTKNTVYKDRIQEKVVYKDKVKLETVLKTVTIHDLARRKITTITEVKNDKTYAHEDLLQKSQEINIKQSQKSRTVSLGCFESYPLKGIQSIEPFIEVNVVGPFNVIAYTDLNFKSHGLGVSVDLF